LVTKSYNLIKTFIYTVYYYYTYFVSLSNIFVIRQGNLRAYQLRKHHLTQLYGRHGSLFQNHLVSSLYNLQVIPHLNSTYSRQSVQPLGSPSNPPSYRPTCQPSQQPSPKKQPSSNPSMIAFHVWNQFEDMESDGSLLDVCQILSWCLLQSLQYFLTPKGRKIYLTTSPLSVYIVAIVRYNHFLLLVTKSYNLIKTFIYTVYYYYTYFVSLSNIFVIRQGNLRAYQLRNHHLTQLYGRHGSPFQSHLVSPLYKSS